MVSEAESCSTIPEPEEKKERWSKVIKDFIPPHI